VISLKKAAEMRISVPAFISALLSVSRTAELVVKKLVVSDL
jgi:hypothetical protein